MIALYEQPARELDTKQLELDYRREVFLVAAAKLQREFHPTTWQAFWETVVLDQSVDDVAMKSAACVLASLVFEQDGDLRADEVASAQTQDLTLPDLSADCQVHVIGIYSAENSSQDDRVYVKIQDTGKQMVVVLCGYFGIQWNMDIDRGAQVKEIILSGWFDHSIVNVPENIPVKKIIGSPRDKSNPQANYFWAYAWHTEAGRTMIEQVKAVTGRGIDTFQGAYGGSRFTIDGKLGLNPDEVAVREKPEAEPASNSFTSAQLSDPAAIEKIVRKSFQLDMDAKLKRITEAEEDIARIKAKFSKRQASAEQLIQERIAALVSDESSSKPHDASSAAVTKDEEITDPTGKGWRSWQIQDFDVALRMFKIAVKREPNNGPAWNGLGWTHLHLAETEFAKEAFEKALAIDPSNGGARNGLGRILMALGKLDDSEKELLLATQETIKEYGEEQAISQGITASWFGLVEVKLLKKDFVGAKEWAERYLKHKPEDVQMSRWLKQADLKMR